MRIRGVEKSIDLSQLPVKGDNIDWKSSVGYKVPFTYDNISGLINIVSYDVKKFQLTVEFNGRIHKINTSNLKGMHISKIVGAYDFIYEVGDVLKDSKRDIVILERRKIPSKGYRYNCNVCGYSCKSDEWITQGSLKNGSGCIVCSGQKVKVDINSIWVTDKWMVDALGMNEADAKKYSKLSTKRATFTCKVCGEKILKPIQNVYKLKSIACSCSEYTSFGEKVIYKLLTSLNIEFIKEYSPKWSNKKKYDFYIPKYNMIIEVHGKQHYEESFKGLSNKSLEAEQANDKYKMELERNHGIKEYIVIDARKSSIDWIKNSVLKSKLKNI